MEAFTAAIAARRQEQTGQRQHHSRSGRELLQLCTVLIALQNFGERLMNVAFYYGSLVAERLRALPLYTSLGTQYGVDCLATPVSPDTSTSYSLSRVAHGTSRMDVQALCHSRLCSNWRSLLMVSSFVIMTSKQSIPWLLDQDRLMLQVTHGSTMFLYNMDWAMEWPRPLPPNVQLVGALLPTPAKRLPPSFEVRAAPPLQDPSQIAL